MKKILCLASAVAALFFGSACTRESVTADKTDGQMVNATFTVTLDGVATKAYSDGNTADELLVGVFDKDGNFISEDKGTVSNKVGTLTTKLVNGATYNLVFWAQKSGTGHYSVDFANKKMTVTNLEGPANDESRDAFCALSEVSVYISEGQGTYINKDIVLKRPFAQINVLAPNEDVDAAKKVGINLSKSSMEMATVPTVLDLFTGEVSGNKAISFTDAAVPEATPHGNYATTHTRILTNYILAGENTSNVTFKITTAKGQTENEPYSFSVYNVPIKKNYRTNIVGDVFRVNAEFDVTINPEFDGDTEVGIPDEKQPVATTVSEIIAFADDTEFEGAEAIVSALTTKGFVATDGTKAIYVYNTEAAGAVKIGDKISFAGKKVTYNGVPEVSPLTEYEVISTGNEVEYQEPADVTADAASYTATEAEYIKLTGTLAKSGNYYNVNIDGITDGSKLGSIVNPVSDLGVDDFDTKPIAIEGYFNGLSGQGKYLNIIAVKVYSPGDGPTPTEGKISEIINSEDGTAFENVEGLVSALTTRGFIVTDGQSAIYVYNSDAAATVKVGDKITFSGTKKTYNGVPEIDPLSSYTVVSSGNAVTYPDPADVTTNAASYTATEAEYIKLTGTLAKSGNYYNVTIDGITDGSKLGSIVNPIADLGVDDFNTKPIAIEGYFNGLSGQGKYLNIIAVKVYSPGDGPTPTAGKIGEIIDSEDGTTFENVEGLVSALTTRGFIVTDGQRAVYVYNSDAAAAVKIGDKITFSGTKKTYGGVPEVDPLSSYTVVSSGNAVTYPEPVDVTATPANYNGTEAEYIKLTGTLAKSGNYYNVNIDGITDDSVLGSIVNPVADLGVDAFDGQKITIEGYFNGFTSKGKYLNIVAVKVARTDDGGQGGQSGDTNSTKISDIIAAEDGTNFENVEGLVMALTTRGFIIADGSGAIYVYNANAAGEVKIGDIVNFTGGKKTYNGVPEIDPLSEYNIKSSGSNVVYPVPTDVTANAATYTATTAEYIKLTGTLAKSGNYYNVTIPGVDTGSKQGSIVYPIASLGVDQYDGQEITVEGYFNGLSSQGKYLNIIAVKVGTPAGSKPTATINIPAASMSVAIGAQISIGATTNSDGTISYAVTSGSNYATVNANGVVSGIAAGTAVITVSVPETNSYKAASATVTITVTDPNSTGGTVTINASDWTNPGEASSKQEHTFGEVSVSISQGTITSDQIRIFKSQTISLSVPSGKVITKIVFSCTANDTTQYGPGCFEAATGYTYDGKIGTWTGSSNSVSLKAESAQVRATSIEVTYQ